MNEYSINITSQFREELDEIYYYIYFTLSSPNTAKVLYSKIKKTIYYKFLIKLTISIAEQATS